MDRTITNNYGFTLIELVLVLAIATIIITTAIHKFNRVSKAAIVTEDMHAISTFLKSKRLTAFTSKQEIDISINSDGTQISAIVDPGGAATTDGTITLSQPVAPATTAFTINTRGLFADTGTIHLVSTDDAGAYSCVVIAQERIRLGGWDGTNCDKK